jgi:LPS export ABC transporter protein LptC
MTGLYRPTCRKSPELKTTFFSVCLLILLLIIAISVTGCDKSVLKQTTAVLSRSLPDETSNTVSIYEYDGNRIDYILTADRIERYYDSRKLNAWKVRIVTYDKMNKVKSTIVADTTYVDEARNLIQAMGNVVYATENGTIKSRLINWDRNVDEIYTPEKVTLIRGGSTLQGENLRTNAAISFAEMSSISAEGTVTKDEIDW